MNFKSSQYITATEIVNEEAPTLKRIIFSARTGIALLVKEEVYQNMAIKNWSAINDKTLQELITLEFIVPSEENEFEIMLEQNIKGNKSNDIISMTIQPTANCQFGCFYCGQEHKNHTAADNLLEKIIERITTIVNRNRVRRLNITWYGGEPLLALQQIKKISGDLIQLAKNKEIAYYSMMITNGLSLKPNIVKELIEKYQVTHYQITIDSLKEHHDARRITKSGEKTYDIIMKNIMNIVELPEYIKSGSITLRMNIDKTNFESIPQFINLLAEHNLHKKKVRLHFAPIVNWGEVTAAENSLSKDGFADKEIDWIMQAFKLGFGIDGLLPERDYGPCMVVDQKSEVYDAYGNIYPCYEFPYTPMYETKDYTIGNVKFAEETYNQDVIPRQWFTDVAKEGTSWCKTCKLYPVCGGGCPKKWYVGEPACPSFKFNLEDKLVLQHLLTSTSIKELI